MRRLFKACVIALAAAGFAVGVGIMVGDIWTPARGIGAGVALLAASTYLLVAF